MKKCKACGKSKDESKFYPTRHGGLLGVCKKCRAKQVMAARARSAQNEASFRATQ